MSSEIAKIRRQIELECQALQHLMRFSAVASHESIQHKYKILDLYHQQLKEQVGDEEATTTVIDIHNRIIG